MQLVAEVGVDAVKKEVALEDTGPALRIIPPGLPAILVRRFRRHQAEDGGRHHLAAVDVGMMQRVDPPTGRVIAGFQGDERRELVLVAQRQSKTDVAAHRLAHDDGLAQIKRAAESQDELAIEFCCQLVFVFQQIEIGLRNRLAMPRHVEGDDAVVRGNIRVAELVAILPAVGAGGVKADERNALSGFLVIGAVRLALALDVDVAAHDRVVCVHPRPPG